MKNIIFPVFLVALIFTPFFSASSAENGEYNGEIEFKYDHNGSTCGKDTADQEEKEGSFTIKNLPKFEDYPAEKSSSKTLDYKQIEPHPDELHILNVRPNIKYSANFNGHYLVVDGQVAQCTGCDYSEIIDINTGKKIGTLDMYQGLLFTKFRQNSSLIIENFPPENTDACIFKRFPTITFYQVKNDKLLKIKELNLSETEEFKKITSEER